MFMSGKVVAIPNNYGVYTVSHFFKMITLGNFVNAMM